MEKGNRCVWVVGCKVVQPTMENSMEAPQNIKNRTNI